MKKIRRLTIITVFVMFIFVYNRWLYAEGKETRQILEAQVAEDLSVETPEVMVAGRVETRAVSTYYSTAKGWTFNDIVYIDECPRYQNAYGGNSTGKLEAGYYRFVKSNGSYVALCDVNLTTNSTARKAYKSLWDAKGGMWKWEQALYNQLDGTREKTNPTDKKTATLENGQVVTDETQNYRFIKCWIKIEHLEPKPEEVKSYTQTVRYFFINENTGVAKEDVGRRKVESIREGEKYTIRAATVTGHVFSHFLVDNVTRTEQSMTYTVTSDKEIRVYYKPYKLTIYFDAGGGTGEMAPYIIYYGEEKALPKNTFKKNSAIFVGWASVFGSAEVSYVNAETIKNSDATGDKNLTLYAVWDGVPNLHIPMLYFTKEELLAKENIEQYILSFCVIRDAEDGVIASWNPERVKMVSDIRTLVEKNTSGRVMFLVKAGDSSGNWVAKYGDLFLVDATAQRIGVDRDGFRYISLKYLDTLEEDSVWNTPEYLEVLRKCLENTDSEKWKKTEFGWQRV